ncbi:MAG: zinc ribbon domain-containing protein [Oscillospiraceae bacterium]|nr:zinc ribbon domain-containing protein [Oscillospiraceae bacterium]
MGFFDEIVASAKSVLGKAEQKTDKVVELSKLKYQSIQLKGEVKALYEKLGQLVYEMAGEEDTDQEAIAAVIEEITEVKAALAVVEDKIIEKRDRRVCANCGAQNAKEAVFCMKCGALLTTAECSGDCENCECEDAPAEECACECENECVCEEAPAEECCCECKEEKEE